MSSIGTVVLVSALLAIVRQATEANAYALNIDAKTLSSNNIDRSVRRISICELTRKISYPLQYSNYHDVVQSRLMWSVWRTFWVRFILIILGIILSIVASILGIVGGMIHKIIIFDYICSNICVKYLYYYR